MDNTTLFKNMIVDQLRTAKKSYTIRGLKCVERGQFKAATVPNIEKMVNSLNSFNSACFKRVFTFKVSSITRGDGFYNVCVNNDILINISVKNNRFSGVEINFSQEFAKSLKR